MNNVPKIQTVKLIYPQIYAYTLPTVTEKNGWIKIGYTERQNVENRIKEQTKTAAINLPYNVLWSDSAQYLSSQQWFKDHDFHRYLIQKNIPKKAEWFFYNGTPEQSLQDFEAFKNGNISQAKQHLEYQLRAEQQTAVEKTLTYFNENQGGEFLWNAKPRFGKTLTTYDLIRQMNARAVLIVTNRPAIANSWFDDFENFIAWQTNYRFISESDSLKDRNPLSRADYVKRYITDPQITFLSLQDLKGSIYFGGNFDKLEWVKQLQWDLLVIDEAHEGVDTLKTDVAFDNITRKFTLHLSGTPFKALAKGNFSEDEIYNWTYADEQQAKQNWADPEITNPYEKLPKLNLFSYQMSQMITDTVNQGTKIGEAETDYAFDLNEFFKTKENGKFEYEKDVVKWLDTLTHNEKYPFSTPKLRQELKHTFWLLNRVSSAKALEKLLKTHPVFENYNIILAVGNGKNEEEEANHISNNLSSLEKVKSAVKNFDKTITLSVGQLTTGVTIPEWSAVMMLSNLKSPSLYMQAAFRSQNPWQYEENGKLYQKENAYVFDFAPERTLQIYDDFANNLSPKTACNNGTSNDREENIRILLNFFPVIAEDNEGKMVELDVNQVLTIPKTLKAQEVVKRGFMSNLLFQNISTIFSAPTEAKEILQQITPVEEGRMMPQNTDNEIDLQDIDVDENGNIRIAEDIVIAETQARFGEKIYAETAKIAEQIEQNETENIADIFATQMQNTLSEQGKIFGKEKGITSKQTERIISAKAKEAIKEVEKIKAQAEIKQKEAEQQFEKQLKQAEASRNPQAVEETKARYETTRQKLAQETQQAVENGIKSAIEIATRTTTQEILEKAEQNKKSEVDEDIRARLRGFSRTIPAFLMAYGTSETTLTNFDQTIDDHVFAEVTGISLEQFRTLRDKYQFFDETVFNQSVLEFLTKRQKLANYFDESQTEDIFDYIPPQKTNQIFTPKKVVKMMIDKLENEDSTIFQNKDKTFADLYMKSGLYIAEIVKRLYIGLKLQIPDDQERLKHILENQVYGFAPTEIIYRIVRNFIFGFDEQANDINHRHIVHLDTTPYAKGETEISLEQKLDQLFKEGK